MKVFSAVAAGVLCIAAFSLTIAAIWVPGGETQRDIAATAFVLAVAGCCTLLGTAT